MLTIWTSIPITKHPGIGACLAITHSRHKELCCRCPWSHFVKAPLGANWSVSIPRVFQNTARIEDRKEQQHLLTKTTVTQTTVAPAPAPGNATLLGYTSYGQCGGQVLNWFTHNMGEYFRSSQHSHFLYFSEILYMAQWVIRHISCPGIYKQKRAKVWERDRLHKEPSSTSKLSSQAKSYRKTLQVKLICKILI